MQYIKTNAVRILKVLPFVVILSIHNCVLAIDSQAIESKLKEQFRLYDRAKNYLIQKVGHEAKVIQRDEWEDLLKPVQGLSAAELEHLRNKHKQDCVLSAKKSQSSSLVNLDKLRKNKELLLSFCNELPKGGMLHVHPSGTITRELAHQLMQVNNPIVSYDKIHHMLKPFFAGYEHEYDFLKYLQKPAHYLDLDVSTQNKLLDLYILPAGNAHSFARFIGSFIIQDLCRSDNNLLVAEILIKNFLSRAKQHGVIYVEFNNHATFDYPITHSNLRQLAKHIREWEKEYGVTVRFNHAFFRVDDSDTTHAQAYKFLELDSPYVTGIDLLGSEIDTPAFEKGQAVYATVNAAINNNNRKLNCTMHAGELGDKRNPRDAIMLGAKRLGHGVALIEDPVVLEYARRQQIAIETNIVSNQRLGVHLSAHNHPFLTYLRLGLKPSLSTDDEGMFETDISQEFFIAIMETDINYTEVKQLVLNSIDTSFADRYTKQRLHSKLIKQFADFEKKWIYI